MSLQNCKPQIQGLGKTKVLFKKTDQFKPARSTTSVKVQQQDSAKLPRKVFLQVLGLTFTQACVAQAPTVVQAPTAAQNSTIPPFLSSTGGKGFLAEEEEKLYNLRLQKEKDVLDIIDRDKQYFNKEVMSQDKNGRLCATPFGVDIVGISQFILFIGALVGGTLARQRKNELSVLNEQLRIINKRLRQTARAGTLYAPGLTYVPPATGVANQNTTENQIEQQYLDGQQQEDITSQKQQEQSQVNNTLATKSNGRSSEPVVSNVTSSSSFNQNQLEERQLQTTQNGSHSKTSKAGVQATQVNVYKKSCREALQLGKTLLKEGNGSGSMVRFEKALMLAKAGKDKIQERRAIRGLAAAARLNNQQPSAIKYLERVLEISNEMSEHTGDADAYGSIADIYTDMGEYEKAAQYYDKYISCMTQEGQVV